LDLIIGWNAVFEALEAERRAVDRVFVLLGRKDGRARRLRALAREGGVPVVERSARRLDELAGGRAHQGVVALAAPVAYAELDRVLEGLGERPPLLVLLDGVEDPHNLGAVLRSAAAAGADAVVLPERRSAGLSGAVSKSAAGGLERVAVVRAKNLVQTAERLARAGLWVVGLDARGEVPWDRVDWTLPTALVVGGEAKGRRPLMRKRCDLLARIPLAGGMESLNVSVAAAVALYEAVRQRLRGAP